jgi:hypothetical protein
MPAVRKHTYGRHDEELLLGKNWGDESKEEKQQISENGFWVGRREEEEKVAAAG